MRSKKPGASAYRLYTGRVMRQPSHWCDDPVGETSPDTTAADLAKRYSDENRDIARSVAEPKYATDDVRYFGKRGPIWTELDTLGLHRVWDYSWGVPDNACTERKLFHIRSFFLRQAAHGLKRGDGVVYHPFPGKTIMVGREFYNVPACRFLPTRYDIDLHPMPKWALELDVTLWHLGTLGILSSSLRFQEWCRWQIAAYQRQYPWRWRGVCEVILQWDVCCRQLAGE